MDSTYVIEDIVLSFYKDKLYDIKIEKYTLKTVELLSEKYILTRNEYDEVKEEFRIQ